MSDTSLRFNFLEGKDTASPAMRKIAANATAMSVAMRVASVLSVAATVTLGAAVLGLVAHVFALGYSLIQLVGLLAVAPAGLLALVAAVGPAIVAFRGLGEAWKATGAAAKSGGTSAADIAHRVELATRGVRDATQSLADAQREARAAQEAVTRAREDAASRLEDLSRALRGARLDERGAVLAVQEALVRLRAARGSGDINDVKRAQLSYEQSVLTLEEVRDRTSDLAKEKETADAQGVEGSEQVQDALQRQEQAQRNLTAATERLADAQRELARAGKGAGGAADQAREAFARLAPSAQDLLLTLRGLGPAWSAAAKATQQEVWAGVAGDIRELSATYLPQMTVWLRAMGQAFNTTLRGILGLGKGRKFAADLNFSLMNIAETFRRLGTAMAPWLSGFMQFVTVGSTNLVTFADLVGTTGRRFEAWAAAARDTGRMQGWITTGAQQLGLWWQLLKDLTMSVVALFRAGENAATLEALVAGTAAMRAWLESAEGQRKVGAVFAYLRDIFNNLIQIIPVLVSNAGGLADIMAVTGVGVGFIADHIDVFAQLLPTLIALYVAWKVSQLAVNAATVVAIPLRIAEAVINVKTAAALTAHTAALRANTFAERGNSVAKRANVTATAASAAAENRGMLARVRAVASVIAMKVALIAKTVATGAATIATTLLSIATAPLTITILLIVAAVALLVLGILWLWRNNEGFRNFVLAAWSAIKTAFKAVVDWVVDVAVPHIVTFFKIWWEGAKKTWDFVSTWFGRIVDFFRSLPGKISAAAKGMWDGIVNAAKGAVNKVLSIWNGLDLGWTISLPDWLPSSLGGGKTFSIPDLIPDIPLLDTGGSIRTTGLAMVHEGERVVPAAQVDRGSSGGGRSEVVLRSDGSQLSNWIMEMLRKAVRDGGGDVQFVLGQ